MQGRSVLLLAVERAHGAERRSAAQRVGRQLSQRVACATGSASPAGLSQVKQSESFQISFNGSFSASMLLSKVKSISARVQTPTSFQRDLEWGQGPGRRTRLE